jgi:hypothetical protein
LSRLFPKPKFLPGSAREFGCIAFCIYAMGQGQQQLNLLVRPDRRATEMSRSAQFIGAAATRN